MKRHLWILVAALGVPACKEKPPPPTPPLPVTVVAVGTSGQGGGETRYAGSIDADASVALAFRVSGVVDEITQVRGADGRMRNLQASTRRVQEAVTEQAAATQTVAQQTATSVAGVSTIAEHATLVRGLSQNAADATAQVADELKRSDELAQGLRTALDAFLDDVARQRANRSA